MNDKLNDLERWSERESAHGEKRNEEMKVAAYKLNCKAIKSPIKFSKPSFVGAHMSALLNLVYSMCLAV